MPRPEQKPASKRAIELKLELNDYVDTESLAYFEKSVEFLLNKIAELEERINELSQE